MEPSRTTSLRPATLCVSTGRPEGPGAPLNTPLVPASNFLLGGERSYARDDGTETWRALEAVTGALEGGRAVAFASGMAAAAALLEAVPVGGRIALPDDCYQGVAALVAEGESRGRWRAARLAAEDTGAWCAAAEQMDLLWLESPSNPLLRIADLAAICAAPRDEGCRVVVDNTFATPLNQRPLSLGADVVVHSATKFIGGHSDLLSGLLVARDAELVAALRRTRNLTGGTPGALEAFLAARGARTLAVRLDRAQANAGAIATYLEGHERIERVRYPGLASHPQHARAKASLEGFGTIVTFDVAGGAAAADRLCERVRLIRHATSLGAVESTLERRGALAGQEHLPPNLIRLSVGVEDVADLLTDLDTALALPGRA